MNLDIFRDLKMTNAFLSDLNRALKVQKVSAMEFLGLAEAMELLCQIFKVKLRFENGFKEVVGEHPLFHRFQLLIDISS